MRKAAVAIAVAVALGLLIYWATDTPEESAGTTDIAAIAELYADNPSISELQDAWQGFVDGISRGRDGIDETLRARSPLPPVGIDPDIPTDRNLVDGYRYVFGYVARLIEEEIQQDGRFPYFNRSMTLLNKWTGDNADQIYLNAAIDAEDRYRIEGKAASVANWRSTCTTTGWRHWTTPMR